MVTVNLISYISLTPAPNGVVEIIVVLDSVSVPNINSDSELQRYVWSEDQSSTTELALNSPPTQIKLSKSISVSTPTLNTIVSLYSQSLFVPSITAKYSNMYSPEAVNS